MDAVRVGRVVRALRIRRRWRQLDLADRVGVSQSLVARVERGGAGRLRLDTLERVTSVLDARLVLRVDWHGEAADRLLDADHAAIVEQVLEILRASGWEALPEATFAIGGERGSVDILAWHEPTRTLLVIEVKSVVPDVQGMLSALDRKIRNAPAIARARGWQASRIAYALVIGEDRTARRRVATHATTFATRFPHGSVETRRFIAHPDAGPTLRGLWFLSPRTQVTTRHRVASPRSAR
jgi:transcriptional regulator with XRE-family HTH domain